MSIIELETAKRINSETFETFKYDTNKNGAEILSQVLINLQYQDPASYTVLLIKNPDIEAKVVNLDRPFTEAGPVPGAFLVPSRKEFGIKITTDFNISRTVLIDLTIEISELMPIIAEKLRFHCQSEQFCLWSVDEAGSKKPLDSSFCIAVQSSTYKNLLFRRRYFLVFVNQFDEMDSCLHIYRDIKYNYLHGPIKAKEEQVINFARLIIYGDAKTLDAAKKTNI